MDREYSQSIDDFRTQEQFESIVSDMINGNWKDAGYTAMNCGFFANDLIRFYKDAVEEHNGYGRSFDPIDFAIVVEIAQEHREGLR